MFDFDNEPCYDCRRNAKIPLNPLDGWRLALLLTVSIVSMALLVLPNMPHVLHLVGDVAMPIATMLMFQTTVQHTQLWVRQRKAAQHHHGKVDVS